MFVTHLNLGRKVDGYLKNGLLEIHHLEQRHEELVKEMDKRGYLHKTPFVPLVELRVAGHVDREANLKILADRCLECRELQSFWTGQPERSA